MLSTIFLANPRGFCAGVMRAVQTVEKALEKFGSPLYVRHEIVHNEHVVKGFEDRGVIFVEELSEVPDGGTVILSAHGVPPEVKQEAEKRRLNSIDATCPLVTKVHLEAIRYHKQGYEILLIGHKGHQEVIGTMGEAPMTLLETAEDAQEVQPEQTEKLICLTQTTLSVDDTKEILDILQERFPKMITPPKGDICYATQNRQDTVKAMAKEVEMILVIGSQKSSNSKRLVETAKKCGLESRLVPDLSDLDPESLGGYQSIGITSGASVPEGLVKSALKQLTQAFPSVQVKPFNHIEENLHFPLPPQLLDA